MNWIDQIKQQIPDYAKDIRLNLDGISRCNFEADHLQGLMLAAAFATGNQRLQKIIENNMENQTEKSAALSAASLMAMNNVWYPYYEMTDGAFKGLALGLRMNAYANHGGTTQQKFESYALVASIIGKCEFCVKSHFELLKKEGYTLDQLKDIGRIAAVINAVGRLLA